MNRRHAEASLQPARTNPAALDPAPGELAASGLAAAELVQIQSSVFDSLHEGVTVCDASGRILYANPAAESLFGYAPGELSGKNLTSHAAYPQEENAARLALMKERLEVEGRWAGEWLLRKKDGGVFLTCTRITRTEVRGIKYWACVQNDVTRDRLAESAAAHLAAIVESSDDAIVSKDLNGKITSWNRGAEHVFGYTAEEAVGRPISMLMVPERADDFSAILKRLQRGERIDHYETLRRRKDGEVITVSLTVSPIRDRSGNIVGASKIARDITAVRRAEEAEKAIKRELLLLIEASSALMASPHSREVLRTIIGLAQQFGAADAHAVWRKEDSTPIWRLVSSGGLSKRFVETGSIAAEPGPALSGEIRHVEDVAQADSIVSKRKDALLAEGIRSMLVIPLSIRGEYSGTVVFYWKTIHFSSPAEKRIASALGNLAAAALGTADLYDAQIQSRERAEASERRSKFLAEAGEILSTSLDYQTTLGNVAKLAVPVFADWCSVSVADERGKVQRVAVYHSDPEKIRFAHEFSEKYPPREGDVQNVVLKTRKSVLMAEIPDELIAAKARDEEHLRLVRKLGLVSVMVVPMVVGAECLGLITFVMSESGRRYTNADLQVAEELARRVATAIAHARLYQDVRANEERLRLAVNAAGLGVWERDLESDELTMSERCKRNFGAAADEEFTLDKLALRVHREDAGRWQEIWRRPVATESTFEGEFRIWWPDGSLHWVLAYGRTSYSEDGRPAKTVGVTLDVTERRELLAREQEARRTAELLNSIGPTLLSELVPERLVQNVTDIARRLVGGQFGVLLYDVAKSGGNPDLIVSGNAPAARRIGMPIALQSAVRLEDVTREQRETLPFARGIAAGVRSYLAVPVKTRAGQLLGALAFGHEEPAVFTERHEEIAKGIAAQSAIALENANLFEEAKATEEALRKSNADLRRLNEDLNQFAYSASHDLQEPLRMVAIYSQLLQRQYGEVLDSKAHEYIRFTVQGAKRMEMLVKDLLAFTQAGELGSDEVPLIEAGAVLEKAIENLRTNIEENQAEISYQALPRVRMKEVHLLQLFQNLVGNAIKYRREDVPPRIAVGCSWSGDDCRIAISDNGIGIPPVYAKQIFGIFKRLHTGEKYTGTGIGLAICQRIVERYGGRIWVEPDPSGGSRFCFNLPRGVYEAIAG